MENIKITGGLRETPEDNRDFPLGAIVSLPKLSELPEEFALETLSIKDQKDTDFCTAFASCLLSEMQEGVELSPEYQFAISKMLSKDPESWGQDIRAMLKSHTKIGALEQREAPYTLENKTAEFLRIFNNWPKNLLSKTGHHRKETFWKVTGPYDHYDNIRASIWKFRKEKRGVISGVIWQWPLSQFQLSGTGNDGFGHCLPYIGWTKEGIVSQNSAGKDAGADGKHSISRETINHFVEKYGAYMMIDLSPEKARYYLENDIRINNSVLFATLKALWSVIKSIWQ